MNKIKIINKKDQNETTNENEALNRKLNINKFYGHLNQNKSYNNFYLNIDYKNKINNHKFDNLKNQLRPINKRNSYNFKSSYSSELFGLKKDKFSDNKSEPLSKINKNNYNNLAS